MDNLNMKACLYIGKIQEYLDYVTEHISNIEKAFNIVTDACKDMDVIKNEKSYNKLKYDVEHHDLSKFSVEEFIPYVNCFYPITKEDKKPLGNAWDNHKACNDHHIERASNEIQLMHMIIDWTAMSLKFGGTAQQYFEDNEEKMDITEDRKKFIYEIFKRLKIK